MVNVRLNAIEITRVKPCLACSRAGALGYDASRDTRLGFRDRPSARASRIRLECACVERETDGATGSSATIGA